MASLPSGWEKKKDTKSIRIYEHEKYIIYIWKYGRGDYLLECFKKARGYKTRLFSEKYTSFRDAVSYANELMKQRRIKRRY